MEYQTLVNKLLTPISYDERKTVLLKLYKMNESLNKKKKSVQSINISAPKQREQREQKESFNSFAASIGNSSLLRPEQSHCKKAISEIDHPAITVSAVSTMSKIISPDASSSEEPDWLSSPNSEENPKSIVREKVLMAMQKAQILTQQLSKKNN